MIEKLFDKTNPNTETDNLYQNMTIPNHIEDRPYIFINMVATLDGKTIVGEPGASSSGLGSSTDQILMRRIEENADCVLIGASTLRATKRIDYKPGLLKAVLTMSGDLPLDRAFWDSSNAIVITGASLSAENEFNIRKVAKIHKFDTEAIDPLKVAKLLRSEYGIRRLLIEGGGTVNSAFFKANIVDELFLTLAPKIKAGDNIPTIAEGAPFAKENIPELELLSVYHDESEIYLRYRCKH